MVLFSWYRSPNLSFSVTNNQLARSGSIAGENDSLGVQEPGNDPDNFVRWLLGCAALNLMMKCYGQWEVNHKYIKVNIVSINQPPAD